MTQVIIVDQVTGTYFNMDVNGDKIPNLVSEYIGHSDARVLMNRLAGGHIDLPEGCIALHIHPSATWVILSMVRDERAADSTHAQLIHTEFKMPEDRKLEPTRYAVFDYEARTLKWIDNPLATEWSTNSYFEASVAESEVDDEIVKVFTSSLKRTLPLHVSVIPVSVL